MTKKPRKNRAYKLDSMRESMKKVDERERAEEDELMQHAEVVKDISHDSPWYAGPYDCDRLEEEVRADFNLQFGRDPERAIHTGGGWLVGPLTEEEVKRGEIG